MTKGKFFIQAYIKERQTYVPVDGYIEQAGGRWFGVHRWEKNQGWTVTELSTGLKVMDGFKTLNESFDSLPKCATITDTHFTGQCGYLYEKSRERCREAYESYPNQKEVASLTRKVFGCRKGGCGQW